MYRATKIVFFFLLHLTIIIRVIQTNINILIHRKFFFLINIIQIKCLNMLQFLFLLLLIPKHAMIGIIKGPNNDYYA